jgi:hypothetical protein
VDLRIRFHAIGVVLLLAVAHMVATVWVGFDNFMQMEVAGLASVSPAARVAEKALAFPMLRVLPPTTFAAPGGGGLLVAALALDGLFWGVVLVSGWVFVGRAARAARNPPR